MSSPARRTPSSSAASHTAAAASTRGPRTSPPAPATSHPLTSSSRTTHTSRTAAAHSSLHSPAASPSSSTSQSQQQQQLADKGRVSGYLSERWMDDRIDALLADKQLTLDSLAELRQQAVEGQWLDDWPHAQDGLAATSRAHHATSS